MPAPISLQMYTVRELSKSPDDYRTIVRAIADIGYVGIEAGPPKDMKPAEFRQFVEDLGMVISSSWSVPTKDDLNKTLDLAEALGVKHLAGGWSADHFTTLDEVKNTADHFQRAAELLAPHGIELCYHNHWWEFGKLQDAAGQSRYGWDVLMELAPSLNCEIDLYWASNFGEVDVPALVKRYAIRTPLVHAKDGPLVKGQPHTAVGSGKFNVASALRATDPARLQWVVVELDEYVGGIANVMDAVRESYRWLTSNGLARGRR